jgi:DNA ligase (NAD+)
LTKDGVQQIEIRGEVVIHKENFAAINGQRVAEGLAPLANPRNAASGALRTLDPAETSRRRLSAILYHISEVEATNAPAALKTHHGSIQWLYSLGFPTPAKELRLFDNIDAVIKYCAEFATRRDDLPFEVDGLVIKVNNIALQEKLGMTSHHPRCAIM